MIEDDKCRQAFEARERPKLDMRRDCYDDYYYDITCDAYRDFRDGYQARADEDRERLGDVRDAVESMSCECDGGQCNRCHAIETLNEMLDDTKASGKE